MKSTRIRSLVFILTFAATAFAGFSKSNTAPAQEVPTIQLDAAKVKKAIEKGIDFLESTQNADGSWNGFGEQKDGSTALMTLALLNAGVSKDSQTIRKALRQIESFREESLSNYTVALRVMVYCAADPSRYRGQIIQDVRWLERAQQRNDQVYDGGWSYSVNQVGSSDGSNSQFSLLALHEARLAGVKVKKEVWESANQYWLRSFDEKQGGFRYYPHTNKGILNSVKGSMTCAGLSSMIIIHENLLAAEEGKDLDIQCCGGNMRPSSIDRAIEWLGRDTNFRVTRNPGARGRGKESKLYYLYGLERAGRLAGLRFFGKHDWYREGADHLIRTQNGKFWLGTGNMGESNREIATAFALLFLSKGRRPIAIGKYQYGDDDRWDLHPKGVHYLTRSIESQWKTKLNWQAIDGRVATVDDLLEAPVLFISGRDEIVLDENQKKVLKEYVDNGGFIFAEACQGDGCGDNVPFDMSFRKLMSEIFPASQLQVLETSHPVWQAWHQLKDPYSTRPVMGIQASCRTSVVYIPANMSGVWQLDQPGKLERHKPEAQKEIKYVTQLGTNIIAYATNRELKPKGDRPKVGSASTEFVGSRILDIPKLSHGGGSDDAPNAWRNLMQVMRFERRSPVKLDKTFVAAKIDEMAKFPIVFMHGRSSFQFSETERTDIKEYIDRGGFIFIDSICSSAKFTQSVRDEMQKIFPDHSMKAIESDDAIWTKDKGGFDVRSVKIRSPIKNDRGKTFRTENTHPLLEGVKIKGRYGVIFSPFDLSCAMENASGSQCKGYDKDDAAKIAINVIVYAQQTIPDDTD